MGQDGPLSPLRIPETDIRVMQKGLPGDQRWGPSGRLDFPGPASVPRFRGPVCKVTGRVPGRDAAPGSAESPEWLHSPGSAPGTCQETSILPNPGVR